MQVDVINHYRHALETNSPMMPWIAELEALAALLDHRSRGCALHGNP